MPTLSMLVSCLSLGMEPALMSAIIAQESSGYAAALHVNRWEGGQIRPDDAQEAAEAARRFVDAGYTVDVGLAGINSWNLERLGVGFDDALEPCTNVALGETIFVEGLRAARGRGHAGDEALRTALSLYNTGSMTRGFDNGYVDKVWSRFADSSAYLGRTRSSVVEWRPADDPADEPETATPSSPSSEPGASSSRVGWTLRAAEPSAPPASVAPDGPASNSASEPPGLPLPDITPRTDIADQGVVIGQWHSAMPDAGDEP